MPKSASLFREGRKKVSDLVRGLTEDELSRPVPATPGWSTRDIICHLAGDAACLIKGDFPEAYFAAFGEPSVVPVLNAWTASHIADREDLPIEEVLQEWDRSSVTVERMMRGEEPWPDRVPIFTDRVLLTDLGVHEQDIYGALGIVRDRDNPLIRVATAGYVASIGFRLMAAGLPPLEVSAGDSVRQTHEGEPAARVAGDRFEMFRMLSGRRSPDQVRALEWTGDPEPYIRYLYPYGIREEALIEP